MATRTKSRSAAAISDAIPPADYRLIPPSNTEERLTRIQALGERVHGYVKFIGAVQKVSGTSAEAKQVAVSQFYDRMLILEQELGRIRENLELG